MTRSRIAEVARSLAAGVVLLVLVVAPPIVLARLVGSPLPHNPNLDDITHSLRGTPISDQVLLKTLAIAGWIGWSNALACVASELVAWKQQRVARHVPLGGLLQPLIAQLVLSVGILLTTARTLTPTASPAAIPLPVTALAVAAQDVPTTAAPTATPAPELPSCVVQRRDSLWVLAERHLGDGMRWREIYELNQGLPQPGGRSLHDPNLILPGWKLRLPPDAIDLPAGAAPVEPAAVPAGAEAAPVDGPSSSTPTTESAATTTGPTTAATEPSNGPASAVPRPGDATADSVDSGDEADDHFPVPAALAGATLLAAALVVKIDALRRRQMRRRPPGHTIPSAPAPAADAERLLRAAAATEPASRLDFALRLLANQLSDAAISDARIDSVRVDEQAIEILLTQPTDATPGPFDVVGSRAWTLPARVASPDLEEVASRRTSPAPALVTVGRLDDADVLIDLETASLTITGHRATAQRILWSITAELATSPWADDVEVLYVGAPPAGLAGLDRIETVSTIAAAGDAVSTRSAAIDRALTSSGYDDAWSARLANHGDGWPPTIVVIGSDHEAVDVPGATVVRVADRPKADERVLVVEEHGCTLHPPGLRLALPGLPAELIELVEQLVATALTDDPGPEIDLRVPEPAQYVTTPDVDGEAVVSAETEGRILVRVLGPVVIDGAPPINRRRVKEFIVYLALHPDGVTDQQIAAALWPGDTPTRAAFNQTVTRARAALGDGPDGQPYVGYVNQGLYRPSPYLLCDAILLEQAAATGATIDGIELRGQPFAASPGFEWAYVEGHAYRASALVERLQGSAGQT